MNRSQVVSRRPKRAARRLRDPVGNGEKSHSRRPSSPPWLRPCTPGAILRGSETPRRSERGERCPLRTSCSMSSSGEPAPLVLAHSSEHVRAEAVAREAVEPAGRTDSPAMQADACSALAETLRLGGNDAGLRPSWNRQSSYDAKGHIVARARRPSPLPHWWQRARFATTTKEECHGHQRTTPAVEPPSPEPEPPPQPEPTPDAPPPDDGGRGRRTECISDSDEKPGPQAENRNRLSSPHGVQFLGIDP